MFDENEKEGIRQDARGILYRFSERLSKVNLPSKDAMQEGNGMRLAGAPMQSDDFRKMILSNAPSKEGDFLMAEKKKW